MKQGFFSEQWTDADGNPAGGVATGRGFTISWQNGPLGKGEARREPNGAFVEDVVEAVADRIRFHQAGKFACEENLQALQALDLAARALNRRTKDRETRLVEGTHEA